VKESLQRAPQVAPIARRDLDVPVGDDETRSAGTTGDGAYPALDPHRQRRHSVHDCVLTEQNRLAARHSGGDGSAERTEVSGSVHALPVARSSALVTDVPGAR
jgi:hypothetical protein